MGIKMALARDSDGNEWRAENYVKGQGSEPLQCMHCLAHVTHQAAHAREFEEKSILVPAYFRLLPGRQHADSCKHAVKEEIKTIVRDSDDLFESIRDEKYRLRLMMIREALEGSKKPTNNTSGGSSSRSGKIYQRARGKLSAYINSARRVLELRALCDGDEEIAEYLELVFEGNTIVQWPEFYYETERHLEAYQTMLRRTVEHPVALHGVVRSIRSTVGKFGPTNVLNLEKARYCVNPNDTNDGLGIEVSVWSKNAEWFSGIQKGSEVVVLGLWKAKTAEPLPSVKQGRFLTFTTHKLETSLLLQTQIARIR